MAKVTEELVLHSNKGFTHLRPQEDGSTYLRPVGPENPFYEGMRLSQVQGNDIQPEKLPVIQVKRPTLPDDIPVAEVEDETWQDGDLLISWADERREDNSHPQKMIVLSDEDVEERGPYLDRRIKITAPIFPPGIPKVELEIII